MSLLAKLRERRELVQDYRLTFGTPSGQRVLKHLLKEAGITVPLLSIDRDTILVEKGRQQIVWSIHRLAHTEIDLTKEIEEQQHAKEQNT